MDKMSEVKERERILAGYADEKELAKEFDVSIQTLRTWRRKGKGPPWVKAPGGIFYAIQESREWLRSSLVQPLRAKAS